MKGHQLDLSTESSAAESVGAAAGGAYLGIRFDCCGAYARIYPNRQGDAYEGRCPKCLRPIRFGIGPGGTASRFFTAS